MDKLSPNSKALQPPSVEASPATPKRLSHIKRCDSRELFSGARELVIEHAGEEYRLRLTNQGKLILTK